MKASLYTLLSIFIFSFNGLAQTDLDSGLIARYTFDNHIKDSSKNKHHGTLVDGTFTTDRFGNPKSALYFDGTNDYASIAKFGKFIPTKDFTMTLWAKSVGNKTSNTLMLMSDNSSNRIALSLYYSHSGSGSFFWDYAGITTRIFVQSVKPSGAWEFFVVYYNSKTKKIGLYRDVKLMQELSTSSVFTQDSTKDLYIGGGADGYYNGTLDDVRFYDRILDTTDLRRLYTNKSVKTGTILHEGQKENILIYPNPVRNVLNVVIPSGLKNNRFKLLDNLGREIISGILTEGVNGVDISALAIGTYTIQTGRYLEIRNVFVKY